MVKMNNYGVIKFISRITTDYILCLVMIRFSSSKVAHLINQTDNPVATNDKIHVD